MFARKKKKIRKKKNIETPKETASPHRILVLLGMSLEERPVDGADTAGLHSFFWPKNATGGDSGWGTLLAPIPFIPGGFPCHQR